MDLTLVPGTTSKTIWITVKTTTTGAPLSTLVFNTAALVAYYVREGDASPTAITLASGTVGTWSSGGFAPVDATNMPGVYELGVPNAALAAGARRVTVQISGAATMQLSAYSIDLTLGVANGPFTAGTNAATAIVSASGDALTLTSGGGNGAGLKATGDGSGDGIQGLGGSGGGNGIEGGCLGGGGYGGAFSGDGSTGYGLYIDAGVGGDAPALYLQGRGSGAGIYSTGGATGAGVEIDGGSTSGNGISISTTDGDGIGANASGTGFGITASGAIGMRLQGVEGLHVQTNLTSQNAVVIQGGGDTPSGIVVTGGVQITGPDAGDALGLLAKASSDGNGLTLAGDGAGKALDMPLGTSGTWSTVGLQEAARAAWGQGVGKWVLSGTTLTLYAPDGATTLKAFTLNSATAPTSRT